MNLTPPHRSQRTRFHRFSLGLIVLTGLTIVLTLAFAIAPDLSALAFQSNSPIGSPSPFPTSTPFPTETPLAATPTLIPPTETPLSPTNTPINTTATPIVPTETPFISTATPFPPDGLPTATEIVIPPTVGPTQLPEIATPTAILVIPPTATPTIGTGAAITDTGAPVSTPITGAIDGPILVFAPDAQPPETNPEALVSLIDTFVLYSAWFLLGCGVIAFGALVAGVIFNNRRARTMVENADDLADEEDVF